MIEKKLVVIGGGAAGFFCAINAARLNPGLKVLLLEKTGKLLSKVKVSGGGRCNVTHNCEDITEMVRKYPRGANLVKKTFHQFFVKDTIEWFSIRGVELKAEKDGRMFPVTDSSQTIIECLLREADKYHVQILTSTEITRIERRAESEERNAQSDALRTVSRSDIEGEERKAEDAERRVECGERKAAFVLTIKDKPDIQCDYLCVACGGYPKSAQFSWLTELGHAIEEPVPSLFTFNIPGHPIRELMGITVDDAIVKVAGTRLEERGPLLITHWGFSGPVILRTSAWGARELSKLNWHFKAIINWVPSLKQEEITQKIKEMRELHPSQKIINGNVFGLPGRLWVFLIKSVGIIDTWRWADLPSKETNKLVNALYHSEFDVKGKTTFKEEFVTAGGIKLTEVDPQTMMSRKVSGLYFAGEILDVDGITGGFNFQHAWTSGYVAAAAIAEHASAALV